MDPTDEYLALVAGPDEQIPLDRCAFLLAAHAFAGLDVEAGLQRLDVLADACGRATLDGLVGYLSEECGFRGNRADYGDPGNSFLNVVLDRRLGIPITLAVLAMSIGRRVGVPIAGVGLPGHFLVRDMVDQSVYVDMFNGGRLLDEAGCIASFHAVHGDDMAFRPEYLEPVAPRAILTRMLTNLRVAYGHRGNPAGLAWVLRLRARMPGAGPQERADLAGVLVAIGEFAQAADEFDELASAMGEEVGAGYASSARRLRARMN